jgi:hypothetical protein
MHCAAMYVLELPRCDNARQDRASQHYIMLALHKDASECEWRFPNLAFLAIHIKARSIANPSPSSSKRNPFKA